jgi:hypothetical protein
MKELIQSYLNWLNQKFSIQEVNGFFEINTPFVNHVNDYIQIYVKQNENGSYLLTDDGETIYRLFLQLMIYMFFRNLELNNFS